MRTIAALALVCAACNQVFGLDPPTQGDGGAAACADDPSGLPDEDGDGWRDACDNCPHVLQEGLESRSDDDDDQIGRACDPHPQASDRVVAFYTFAEPVPATTLVRVSDAGGASWEFGGGDLRVRDSQPVTGTIARLDVGLAAVTIDVDVTLPTTLPTLEQAQSRSLGVWADAEPPPGGTGYNPTSPPGAVLEIFEANGTQLLQGAHLGDTSTGLSATSNPSPEYFMPGRRYRLVLTCEGDGLCTGTIYQGDAVLDELPLAIVGRAGSVGLRSYAVDGRFHHAMIYTRAP